MQYMVVFDHTGTSFDKIHHHQSKHGSETNLDLAGSTWVA